MCKCWRTRSLSDAISVLVLALTARLIVGEAAYHEVGAAYPRKIHGRWFTLEVVQSHAGRGLLHKQSRLQKLADKKARVSYCRCARSVPMS